MTHNTEPVVPERFAELSARCDALLTEHEQLHTLEEAARIRLAALQCGQTFTEEHPDPDGDGVVEWESRCRLPAAHAGVHAGNVPSGTAEGDDFTAAAEEYQRARSHASRVHRAWQDADDELDELRCGRGGGWGCRLGRGHDGGHFIPDAMRLIF